MRTEIINSYMLWVNEHESEPKSVFKFCQENEFSESEFYDNFSDLQSVKEDILAEIWVQSVNSLSEQEFYTDSNANEKLLSVMYGFFENLKTNRSYLAQAFKGWKNPTEPIHSLSPWRKEFLKYIDSIDLGSMSIGVEMIDKNTKKVNSNALFANALFVFHFWLNDKSKGFEKTDACIEKLFVLSFDLMQNDTLKKAIDLGKFLFQAK
ncbi:MAG: TetR family transcriptional regulator C-terminal domain-containing protein [Bacteroidia bacterium]